MQQQLNFSVHPNSLHALEVIKPNLQEKEKAVLNALRHLNGATRQEVAEYLGVPVHTITGRFTRLINDLKLVKEDGNRMVGNRKHAICIAV